MKPYLSVIVPAYNESENITHGALRSVCDYLSKQKYTWEVIVINDGSSDDTSELLNKSKLNIKIINNTHQGKASTILTGGLVAKGEIILFTDMDQEQNY